MIGWEGRRHAHRVADLPRPRAALPSAALLLAAVSALGAQEPTRHEAPGETERISVEWIATPMEDVLQAFAEFSGKSIVAGPEVAGFVTAFVEDQPWDVALKAILSAHGLATVEDDHGIIRVGAPSTLGSQREEPIHTRAYRLSYAKASELLGSLAPHLSASGSISLVESRNTLIITDFESVHRVIAGLLR